MSTDVKTMSTPDLIALYNRTTGKSIKKFSSRAAGEAQVVKALAEAEKKEGDQAAAIRSEQKASTRKPRQPRAPRVRKEPAPKKTKEEIHASMVAAWKDPATRAARAKRTNVRVGGETYRSVFAAFKALKLPMNKMVKFRLALKASAGRMKFQDHEFSVVKNES